MILYRTSMDTSRLNHLTQTIQAIASTENLFHHVRKKNILNARSYTNVPKVNY